MIVLQWEDETFIESKEGSSGIRVELDKASQEVRLILLQGTNLIERRVAMRQAESIARSGFLRSNGERVGRGWKFVIDERGTALPDRLTVSPRVSYSSTDKTGGQSAGRVVEE